MLNIRTFILLVVLVLALAVSFVAIKTGAVSNPWNNPVSALDNQDQTTEQHIMFHPHGYRSTHALYPSISD